MQHIAVEVFSQQAGCMFESRCAKCSTTDQALILSILYSLLTWDSAIAWVACQSKGAHNFNPKGNLCRWTAGAESVESSPGGCFIRPFPC